MKNPVEENKITTHYNKQMSDKECSEWIDMQLDTAVTTNNRDAVNQYKGQVNDCVLSDEKGKAYTRKIEYKKE